MSGRLKGTAEVVFARKVDALAAVRRYNYVQLDGKPMKIEIVGSNMEKPATTTRLFGGGFQSSNRVSRNSMKRDLAENVVKKHPNEKGHWLSWWMSSYFEDDKAVGYPFERALS